MNPITYQILLTVLASIIAVLCTYYFTTRNTDQKMSKVAEEISAKSIDTHNAIKHQDSMYKYFDEEITKHQNSCGAINATALKAVETKLQHMEIKEVKNSMILSGISRTVSIIARKMKITDIEIPDTDKDEG